MIHLFEGKGKIFTFPRRWANSVTKWILGVHSPSGTISIRNTASPGDDGSIALDVNVDALVGKIEARLEAANARQWTDLDRKRVREIIYAHLDGSSVIWKDNRLSISLDWLQQAIASLGGASVTTKADGGIASGSDGIYLDNPLAPSSATSVSSGYEATASYILPLSDSAATATAAGITLKVATRLATDNVNGALHFRTLTFDKSGRLVSISSETEYCGVNTDISS